MNPVEFYWSRLGRHLMPQDRMTGDLETDAATSLSMVYPHRLTDRERALSKLQEMRQLDGSVDHRKALREWATTAAKYAVAGEIVGDDSLSEDEKGILQEALRGAGKGRKVKDAMPGVRLTEQFLAILRADKPTTLVANLRPANPSEIDLRPCSGIQNYMDVLLDAVVHNTPEEAFMVIEFDRSTAGIGDLFLNLPTAGEPVKRLRISGPKGGLVKRDAILSCLEQFAHDDDLVSINLLARLADWEASRLQDGEGDFRALDRLSKGLPSHVEMDELLDVLPRRGSPDWRIMEAAYWQVYREKRIEGVAAEV